MAKSSTEAPQPGIIGRTIRTIKTAIKVVVGLFLLAFILAIYLDSMVQTRPGTASPITPSPNSPIQSVAAAVPASTSAPSVEVPTVPESPEPVTLARPGGAGKALVCPNRGDYEELQQILAGVEQGRPNLGRFSQMSDEFKILRIPNGTHAVALRTERGARFVRLTDGYRAGQSGWVDAKHVFPVAASDREPAPEARSEQPKPIDPEKRAETILGMGRNLESMGKAAAALQNYRRVVAEFPGTKAAAAAALKVEALGRK